MNIAPEATSTSNCITDFSLDPLYDVVGIAQNAVNNQNIFINVRPAYEYLSGEINGYFVCTQNYSELAGSIVVYSELDFSESKTLNKIRVYPLWRKPEIVAEEDTLTYTIKAYKDVSGSWELITTITEINFIEFDQEANVKTAIVDIEQEVTTSKIKIECILDVNIDYGMGYDYMAGGILEIEAYDVQEPNILKDMDVSIVSTAGIDVSGSLTNLVDEDYSTAITYSRTFSVYNSGEFSYILEVDLEDTFEITKMRCLLKAIQTGFGGEDENIIDYVVRLQYHNGEEFVNYVNKFIVSQSSSGNDVLLHLQADDIISTNKLRIVCEGDWYTDTPGLFFVRFGVMELEAFSVSGTDTEILEIYPQIIVGNQNENNPVQIMTTQGIFTLPLVETNDSQASVVHICVGEKVMAFKKAT